MWQLQLTQLETKLVKLKRALPIDEQEQVMVDGPGKSDGRLRADVSQEELEQLTDEVFEATKRVSQKALLNHMNQWQYVSR